MCSFRCYEDLTTCGEGGILTTVARRATTVFETAPIGRSGTSPGLGVPNYIRFLPHRADAGKRPGSAPRRAAGPSSRRPRLPLHAPGRSCAAWLCLPARISPAYLARRAPRARRAAGHLSGTRNHSLLKIFTRASRSASWRPRVSGACQETIITVLRGSSILLARWWRIRPTSAMPEAEMITIGSACALSALNCPPTPRR